MNGANRKILGAILGAMLLLVGTVMVIVWFPKASASKVEIQYLIGMSHPNLTDEWQIVAHEEMIQTVSEYPNIKLIFTDANSSSYKQIKDIDQMMDYGIDLLIITVNDANVLGDKLNQVYEKIPVIVLNKDAQFYNYTLYIGPDYKKIGKLAGERFETLFRSGKANLLTLSGPIEEESVSEMNEGLNTYLRKTGQMTIGENIFGNWLKSQATKDVQAILDKRGQSFQGVFAESFAMALGASEILRKENAQLPCLGVSEVLTLRHLAAITTGQLDSLIYTPVGGREAISYAVKILEGNRELPKKIILKSNLITSENAPNYISQLENAEIQTQNSDDKKLKEISMGYIQTELWDDQKIQEFPHLLIEKMKLTVDYKAMPIDASVEKKAQLQKQYFKEFLDQKVNIIVLNPLENSGWEDLLNQATSANVSVVLLGNELSSDAKSMTYIGPSYINQGKIIATSLVTNLYGTSYTLGVLEITQETEKLATQYRMQGFRLITNGYSRIKIMASMVGSADEQALTNQVVDAFLKHPNNIDAIYAYDESFLPGIYAALKELKLEVGKDVKILLNNSVDAEVYQNNILIQVRPSQLYENQLQDLLMDYEVDGQIVDKIILPDQVVTNNK